jgi:hypothetical protein
MSPEQMFSLFAGFIAASVLIWVSNVLETRKKRQLYSRIVPVDPDNKTKSHQENRIQESYLNVSTFFGLRR